MVQAPRSDARELQRIPVADGAMPAAVLVPAETTDVSGVFVVPSIFGPAPDLVARLGEFSDRALVVVPDPFWRVGGGVVPYGEHDRAVGRLGDFSFEHCIDDLGRAIDWTAARCNGRIVGVGICFGGPFVLRFAAEGRLHGAVTWHGSRMQDHLERAEEISCPVRFHFGDADPITPPPVIDAVRRAFASHPDAQVVVHPGADHGFSHDGESFDECACRAGLDAVAELLSRSSGS